MPSYNEYLLFWWTRSTSMLSLGSLWLVVLILAAFTGFYDWRAFVFAFAWTGIIRFWCSEHNPAWRHLFRTDVRWIWTGAILIANGDRGRLLKVIKIRKGLWEYHVRCPKKNITGCTRSRVSCIVACLRAYENSLTPPLP